MAIIVEWGWDRVAGDQFPESWTVYIRQSFDAKSTRVDTMQCVGAYTTVEAIETYPYVLERSPDIDGQLVMPSDTVRCYRIPSINYDMMSKLFIKLIWMFSRTFTGIFNRFITISILVLINNTDLWVFTISVKYFFPVLSQTQLCSANVWLIYRQKSQRR